MDTVKLSERQLKLVKDIVTLGKGRTVFQRKELKAMHFRLRGRTASPYFIVKNKKAKVTKKTAPRGTYTLERFLAYAQKKKLSAARAA
jgi:hypothetical protein